MEVIMKRIQVYILTALLFGAPLVQANEPKSSMVASIAANVIDTGINVTKLAYKGLVASIDPLLKTTKFGSAAIKKITENPILLGATSASVLYGWYYKKQMEQARPAIDQARNFLKEMNDQNRLLFWGTYSKAIDYPCCPAEIDGEWVIWNTPYQMNANKKKLIDALNNDYYKFDFCKCKNIDYAIKIKKMINNLQNQLSDHLNTLAQFSSIESELKKVMAQNNIKCSLAEMGESNFRIIAEHIAHYMDVSKTPSRILGYAIAPYKLKAEALYWKLLLINARLEVIKSIVSQQGQSINPINTDGQGQFGKKQCISVHCCKK